MEQPFASARMRLRDTIRWELTMAWRDSRGSRRRLLLFTAAMTLGVAALVAINSFGDNLRRTIDAEAQTILGADLVFERNRAFPAGAEALIDSIGGLQARRITFASMALFPRTGQTRLATIRAIEGDYPWYGQVETAPTSAARTYLSGRNALVDGTLLRQFGLQVGDSVQVGSQRYRIAGELIRTPREAGMAMLFSPRIFVPLAHLDRSLLVRGSNAGYEVFFRFPDGRDAETLRETLRPRLETLDVDSDTIEETREDWNEALTNIYRFLSLVGLVALLLGSVGVASAVHVYVRQRVETVAVMRCFGAEAWQTFRIYLVQAGAMGLVGSVAGALLGIGVQVAVPGLLADFLPVPVAFSVTWTAVLLGVGIGLGVTLLFALLPLLSVRNIAPLRVLRAVVEGEEPARRDPLRWGLYGVLACSIAGVAVLQAPNPWFGLGYAAGLGVVFGLLALVARGLMALTRRYFPSGWTYVWRQGLANLYRPNNQTLILMLSLGLGTFLITTMYLVEQTLVNQVQLSGGEGRPNLVFFDIQPDQRAGVRQQVEAANLPVLDEVPLVTMRIHRIKGRTLDELRADSTFDLTWAHHREYRSSYRATLSDAETLVEGTFVPSVPPGTAVVPVSIDEELARDELEVALGDTVVFDVQGRLINTVIGSMRRIDWERFQTNFFFVFPDGALNDAPQFSVLLTRTPDNAASARLQQAVVEAYPSVSALDLSTVLNTFEAIFSRINFVIRFMALFSILTGLLVLAGAVVVSRYRRIEESVLLKTLGASRRQVLRIMAVEYLFLGLFATLTGLVLALGASGALAQFVFETPLVVPPLALPLVLVIVCSLTIGIGLLNSRGIYSRPPLEVLRAET
jgi:putative ABC transport system permease protein